MFLGTLYFLKLVDRSEPKINRFFYETELTSDINFEEQDINWAFYANEVQSGDMMTYTQLQENFTLEVAYMRNVFQNGEIHVIITNIPIMPCSEHPNYKKYKLDKIHLPKEDMICLDFTGIIMKSNDVTLYQSLNIGLFDCQESPENISRGITVCANNIEKNNIVWTPISIEKHENLLNIDNPFIQTSNIHYRSKLETGLTRVCKLEYGKIILNKKKIFIGNNEEKIEVIKEHHVLHKVNKS